MAEITIENLYEDFHTKLQNLNSSFRRAFIDDIDWNEKLNVILGARGVGKTTLILQHIQETHDDLSGVLFISMDDILTNMFRLVDIAKYHVLKGGTHLYIDEIHKYFNWSQELKNIYDRYNSLKVVATGSSILDLQKGQADLSRRAVETMMPGLSLREYINIERNLDFPACSLEDILENHVDIVQEILKVVTPGQYFTDYLKHGYYPFYLQGRKNYQKKLHNIVNMTIEVDMLYQLNMEVSNIHKVKKLIYILSNQAPFTPNISKLGVALELNRVTVYKYLNYLANGSITRMIWPGGKSFSAMQKPDKLFLHNTNLFYLTQARPNIGSLRESFFVNQLSHENSISIPTKGDFMVNDIYTFEIGGKGKTYKQIANIPDSYIVSDDILIGRGNKIPLWLFGWLY